MIDTAKIRYRNTRVPPERTKADIEKMLREHGIEDIQWTTYRGETSLKFIWKVEVKGVYKEIMFEFKPPIITAYTRKRVNGVLQRVQTTLDATAYRLLWHYLKNKLEAVRWGMESMEKEFLSHAVVSLPDGSRTTIGEDIGRVFEAVTSPALTYVPENQTEKR